MASIQRSRRADGLSPHSTLHTHTTKTKPTFPPSVSIASKRLHDGHAQEPIDINPSGSTKRPRLTINLSSSPITSQRPRLTATSTSNSARPQSGGDRGVYIATSSSPQTSNAITNPHNCPRPSSISRPPISSFVTEQSKEPLAPLAFGKTEPASTLRRAQKTCTRELSTLQVSRSDPKATEGRKLRSQENTRLKSDLAFYFPDFDEVIGNEPRKENLVECKTPILVIDDIAPDLQDKEPPLTGPFSIRSFNDDLFTRLLDTQVFDLAFLHQKLTLDDYHEDPLPDTIFKPAHKRAERAERSVRNTERGRAQHEKGHIIRLLDGLQGHDWLRVMGVNGITESKKREFEEPRQHFIRGCESILDKFRQWGVEEKRRKLEKGRAMAQMKGEANDDGDEETDNEDAGEDTSCELDENITVPDSEAESDMDPHTITRRYEDSRARSRLRKHLTPTRILTPPLEVMPPKPFRSFFDRKYLRDAALSKNRRKGRTVLAWGCAVPELTEADFVLPEEFLDGELLRRNARRKRRDKRSVLRC